MSVRLKRAITATVGASALLVGTPNAVAAEPSWGLRDGYKQIYERVDRLGGQPGRNIVVDGIRRDGEARSATRRDVIRAIRVLRRMEAGLRGTPAGGGSSVRATTTAPAGGGSAGGGSVASAGLQAIAACESGGNPRAVSPDGRYRGKYQFDRQTWRSVGGSGDPAAASEAEQDRRAAALMAQRGSSPWPVCG